MTKIQHLDSKDNPTNAHYHFEGAKQNPAGFDLNKRVCAVYQLSGYIHQISRNHPDNTESKPHWQYINQGGTLTEFESDHSAKGVERKLLDALKGSKDPTPDLRNGMDGAEEKLAAAENLKQRLELIQKGEPPYDIFVRWKPLEEQPIGWNPDLNDGVRLNIRPFLMGDSLGKRGSGIPRDKPNVKWTKDRGKDVESAPWYPVFQGDRINDHHLTRAEKEAARNSIES